MPRRATSPVPRVASVPALTLLLMSGLGPAGCTAPGGGAAATSADADRLLEAGDKALAAGNTVQALVAYRHARDLAPTGVKYHQAVWRGAARLVAESPERLTVDNLEEIRFEVGQLLEAEPKSPVYLTAMAHVLERDGKRAEAGKLLDEAVAADGKSAVAQAARGSFLMRTGATAGAVDDALSAFEAAVAADPKHVGAYLGLGRLYVLKKDAAKELSAIEKAVALAPESYAANEALGDACLHAGKLIEAFRAYTKAAQIEPKNPEPHLGLGVIKSQAGKWAEAEAELRIAMRGARVPGLEVSLAQAVARQPGRCGEAASILSAFLLEQPEHPAALFELASCQAQLERKDDAQATLRRLLALPLPPEGDPRRDEAQKRSAAAEAKLAALGGGGAGKKPRSK